MLKYILLHKGTNIMSFEMVRANKLFCQCFWAPDFHIKITSIVMEFIIYYVSTTLFTRCNQWKVSLVDKICHVWRILWPTKSNLMILDNSGIDYEQMLIFVFGFLVYWKIARNSRSFSRLQQYLKAVTSMLSKKQNVTSEKTIFTVLFQ